MEQPANQLMEQPANQLMEQLEFDFDNLSTIEYNPKSLWMWNDHGFDEDMWLKTPAKASDETSTVAPGATGPGRR